MMILKEDNTISLEPFIDQQADAFFTLINTNREHLREWLTWPNNICTAEDFSRFMAGAKERQRNKTEVSFAIFYNGHLAGRIGLYTICYEQQSAHMGYWLGKDFEGKGIITKTGKYVVSFAFTNLHLKKLILHCATGNHKSCAIAERLHFKKAGIIEKGELLNNNLIDLSAYSLSKQDWEINTNL